MNRIIPLVLLLFSCLSTTAQKVKIVNNTKANFKECHWILERDSGRHNAGYLGSIWNNPKYDTPALTKESKNYDGNITFKEEGKYTLILNGANDSIYYKWDINIGKKTKKIVVDNTFLRIHKSAFEPKSFADELGRVDLYFKFTNKTKYKIYACFPWISDESFERDDILRHNPDNRLDPQESRALLVVPERTMQSYPQNGKIQFRYVGVDQDGNMVSFYQDGITKLEDEDVIISPNNIKMLNINEIPSFGIQKEK